MGNFAFKEPPQLTPDCGLAMDLAQGHSDRGEDGSLALLAEETFRRVLALNRKRSERSRQRFVLMLAHLGNLLRTEGGEEILGAITKTFTLTTRETDFGGWYKKGAVIGFICTELGPGSVKSILDALKSRLSAALQNDLNPEQMNAIEISFHVFPDDLDFQNAGCAADSKLYPDLGPQNNATKALWVIKRSIDIVGSLIALILLSPLLIAIAIAIKLTSSGPILFRQPRVGQHGVRFTFLKFRSMRFGNDPKIHQDYVRQLILGKEEKQQPGASAGVYKLKDDPRITPVGKFLRRTSLDELPQFLNVLIGEMSLVGPRPPIPYEVETYDIWHKRRLLEVRPGITGLWQVEGRSSTKFDEMVRLDLRYAKTWSLWLDIKILVRTPGAVLKGSGAY